MLIQYAVGFAGGDFAHLFGLLGIGVGLQLAGGPNGSEDGGFLGFHVLLLGYCGKFAVRQGLAAHSYHPVGVFAEDGQMLGGVGQLVIQLKPGQSRPVLGRGGLPLDFEIIALGLYPSEGELVVTDVLALKLQVTAQKVFPDDGGGKIAVADLVDLAVLPVGLEGEYVSVSPVGQRQLTILAEGEDGLVLGKGADNAAAVGIGQGAVHGGIVRNVVLEDGGILVRIGVPSEV